MTIFCGVDPGLTGGLAVLPESNRGAPEFYDLPTLQVKSGKTMKNVPDAYALATLLQGISAGRDILVTVENVNAMPVMGRGGARRMMPATSSFNFGYGFGIWIGVLSALRIPHQLVHPITWKKNLMSDMGKEKDASRVKAMQLYPFAEKGLARKKDHGRADALLIGLWGKQNYNPQREAIPEFQLEREQLPF